MRHFPALLILALALASASAAANSSLNETPASNSSLNATPANNGTVASNSSLNATLPSNATAANNASALPNASLNFSRPIAQFNPLSEIYSLTPFLVPKGASFAIVNVSFRNSVVHAVIVEGDAYAVFAPDSPSLSLKPLTRIEDLEAALNNYYYSLGHSPKSLDNMAQAHEGLVNISDDYFTGEGSCRIMLGTDRFPCDSFDTCQKACYAVTSFCQPVALGSGRVFINVIWEFENSSRRLSEAYSKERQAYLALVDNKTAENYAAYLSSIGEINKAATRASLSQLYDEYSYCFQPDYSLSKITTLQLSAQNAYRLGIRFLLLSQSADLVRNRTLDALTRKSMYDSALEAARNQSIASNLSKQNASSEPNATIYLNSTNSTPSVPPQQPQERKSLPAETLVGLALVILVILTAALYILKMRKSGYSTEDQHKKTSEAFHQAHEEEHKQAKRSEPAVKPRQHEEERKKRR